LAGDSFSDRVLDAFARIADNHLRRLAARIANERDPVVEGLIVKDRFRLGEGLEVEKWHGVRRLAVPHLKEQSFAIASRAEHGRAALGTFELVLPDEAIQQILINRRRLRRARRAALRKGPSKATGTRPLEQFARITMRGAWQDRRRVLVRILKPSPPCTYAPASSTQMSRPLRRYADC
jgi:hypothetical protein